MTVRSLSLDKEVVTKDWICADCICENIINYETFLNSTNNGIMIKLGKKWILAHEI